MATTTMKVGEDTTNYNGEDEQGRRKGDRDATKGMRRETRDEGDRCWGEFGGFQF